MPVTKKHVEYTNNYVREKYDRISVNIPKGRKADVESYASAHGETVNGLINRLIREELGVSAEAWRGKDAPETNENGQ